MYILLCIFVVKTIKCKSIGHEFILMSDDTLLLTHTHTHTHTKHEITFPNYIFCINCIHYLFIVPKIFQRLDY